MEKDIDYLEATLQSILFLTVSPLTKNNPTEHLKEIKDKTVDAIQTLKSLIAEE